MLRVKAHAKINWSLNVLSTRPDGYHNLDMLMQPLELADEITFSPAKWVSLKINGRQLPVGGRNLILQAANALNDYVGKRRGAAITLKKRIPVRAGLGGGSADCAATLLALNELWNLRLPMQILLDIGRKLGADVPFCLMGGLQRVQGIGEEMHEVGAPKRYPLVLLHPGGGLSTAHVFSAYDASADKTAPADIDALTEALGRGDLTAMRRASGNSLEPIAIDLMPEIGEAMARLTAEGAHMARMTGSGSCVFGVFSSEEEAERAAQRLPGAIFTRTME